MDMSTINDQSAKTVEEQVVLVTTSPKINHARGHHEYLVVEEHIETKPMQTTDNSAKQGDTFM